MGFEGGSLPRTEFWNELIFKVPSNPKHFGILLIPHVQDTEWWFSWKTSLDVCLVCSWGIFHPLCGKKLPWHTHKKMLKLLKLGKNFRNVKVWEQRKVCAPEVSVRSLHGRRICLNLGSLLPSGLFFFFFCSLHFHDSPYWGQTPGFALSLLTESPHFNRHLTLTCLWSLA